MARYAGSQGKGPKKTKRDKLKASVHIETPHDAPKYSQRKKIVKINDNDPKVYGERGDRHGQGRYSKAAAKPNLFRHKTTSKEMSSKKANETTKKKYPSSWKPKK